VVDVAAVPVDLSGEPLRLMLVHAHPDDETTTTGATIARYVAQGVAVTLVTCSRGERGEIVDPQVAEVLTGPASRAATWTSRRGNWCGSSRRYARRWS
jgi:N-acetyl-1-D-myo-inositol-2-amino-2-deoxy-alpha-D-glucopyranoside deacetylase